MFQAKIQHTLEAILLGITIHWQPLFGMMASAAAIIYYVAMLKMYVVDRRFGGSWKQYVKSIFKL